MPSSPYKDLPLETLQELLLVAVRELLEAMDGATPGDGVSVKPKKRQVEQLYNAIVMKSSKRISVRQ